MSMKAREGFADRASPRCILCYQEYEPHPTRAWLYIGRLQIGELCPNCLKAGPQGAAVKVRAWAEELRTSAQELRSWAEDADFLAQEVERIPQEKWPGGEALQETQDEIEGLLMTGQRGWLTTRKMQEISD